MRTLSSLFAACALLLTHCHASTTQEVNPATTPAATPSLAPAAPTPTFGTKSASQVAPMGPIVCNLDALYGLSIGQLRARLGNPVKEMNSNMDGSTRSALFKKEEFLLDVDYTTTNNRVEIIHFMDAAGKLSYHQLLTLVKIDTTSTHYKVTPSRSPFMQGHTVLALVPISY